MGKDYYNILGVNKTATTEEIKKAYKKMALKWHPDRCPVDTKDKAQAKFQDIGQAYETLSDPAKRRVYDQVGEEGMRMGGMPEDAGDSTGSNAGPSPGGMPNGFGGFNRGQPGPTGGQTSFRFSSDGSGMAGGAQPQFTQRRAEDIFRAFFGGVGSASMFGAQTDSDSESSCEFGGPGMGSGGSANPFMQFGGGGFGSRVPSMDGGFGQSASAPSMSTRRQQQTPKQADPVQYPLNVTLEELYTGTTKKVRITKKIFDAGSGALVPVSTEKEIEIKPGWKDGTKITFEREGDEGSGIIPADIVFTITTKKHDRFEREGDDLICTCRVSLADAITGVRGLVLSLDRRRIDIVAMSVTPDTVKIIPGEGMINNKKRCRGDLKVKFKVDFPDNLTDSERSQIGSILQNAAKRRI